MQIEIISNCLLKNEHKIIQQAVNILDRGKENATYEACVWEVKVGVIKYARLRTEEDCRRFFLGHAL